MAKNDKKLIDWMSLIGGILVGAAIVLLIWFLLRGETRVEGEYAQVEKTESLSCEINGLVYPFFDYDNSISKTMSTNVIFEDNLLSSISLTYTLYYSDSNAITDSENLNHAAMNINFGKDKLGADVLGLKFSFFPEGLQFSLYSNKDDINSVTTKYFMLDDVKNNYSMSNVLQNYESKGFVCKNNN